MTERVFEIIRDPLGNNIRVDAFTMRLVDTPAFQRLRDVRPTCGCNRCDLTGRRAGDRR